MLTVPDPDFAPVTEHLYQPPPTDWIAADTEPTTVAVPFVKSNTAPCPAAVTGKMMLRSLPFDFA